MICPPFVLQETNGIYYPHGCRSKNPNPSVNGKRGLRSFRQSLDPTVGISLHRRLMFDFFLTYDIKIVVYYPSFLLIFDILRRITTFSERQSVFFAVVHT